MYPIPFATVDEVVEIAKHTEALGYDSVWDNDHMTMQRYVRTEYLEPSNYGNRSSSMLILLPRQASSSQ